MTAEPVIAILEDHQLISASLSAALRADGYRVVNPPLVDPDLVMERLRADPPAVVLLDLDLGSFGNGEDLLSKLLQLRARVVVVSGNGDDVVMGRCLDRGAWACVPKTASFETLVDAISMTLAGREVMAAAERDRLLHLWRRRVAQSEEDAAPMAQLTRREAEVLTMLVDGLSVDRIAAASFVSVATVRSQVRAILHKLGVRSQLEAVAMANRAGWRPG